MVELLTKDSESKANYNPIYNTIELSKLLKVSTRTIQRWRDMGTIRFSAIGSKFYYTHEDVVYMLNKNRVNYES